MTAVWYSCPRACLSIHSSTPLYYCAECKARMLTLPDDLQHRGVGSLVVEEIEDEPVTVVVHRPRSGVDKIHDPILLPFGHKLRRS